MSDKYRSLENRFKQKFNFITNINIMETSSSILTNDQATIKSLNGIKGIFERLLLSNKFGDIVDYQLSINDDVFTANTLNDWKFENFSKHTSSRKIIETRVVEKEKIVEVPVEKIVVKKEIIHDKPDVKKILSDNKINYPKKLADVNSIIDEGVKLAEYGKNNTQIFTREVDIKSMIQSIGEDKILDPATTILEPTAGDGAFTVRILSYRLKKIENEETELRSYMLKSLHALSTIYAIEYEDNTCYAQRNNLYSTMQTSWKNFVEKINIEDKTVNKDWDILVKKIIFDNIMWGAFAAKNHPEYKNYEKVLGFDRASNRPLVISKWSFTIDKKLRIKYRKELIS